MNLKEQFRLVELKKMLSQYRIRSFHVSYAARAKVREDKYVLKYIRRKSIVNS